MSEPQAIKIPLINPNEPEALLAAVYVEEGQKVEVDDLLCTLETTKATAELLAEEEGYVIGIQFHQGDTARAGDVFAYLADSPDASPPLVSQQELQATGKPEADFPIPKGLRITQPALALAREHHLDLSAVPEGALITASVVRSMLEKTSQGELSPPVVGHDSTAIFIYGCGGHGKAVLELIQATRAYRVVGFVDDGVQKGEVILGVPVLGGREALPELYAQGVRQAANAVGGIGSLGSRLDVFQAIAEAGFACPAIVHPTAYVEPSARLDAGVQVFPLAYVGSAARVSFGSIVNTGAIVSHDCQLGKYVNISPGAILAGEVRVDDGALVGMGVTVNLQVHIGTGARIGNGATVKSDVPANGVVRAGSIWPA